MYAIIEDSGTQIKVSEGDVVEIDLRDLPAGSRRVTFPKVLAIGGTSAELKVGAPYLKGASVEGELVGDDAGVEEFRTKTIARKYSRRKGYRKTIGHTQRSFRVKIEKITAA